jgi:hypothetical protein
MIYHLLQTGIKSVGNNNNNNDLKTCLMFLDYCGIVYMRIICFFAVVV